MASPIERRRLRLRRETLLAVLGVLLFGILYVAFLAFQNSRAESYYENLRKTDPVRYLDDLRRNQGFASYLDTYRLLEGYGSPKAAAPSFLVGRWTMRTATMRVTPGSTFSNCSDPVAFEHGLIEIGAGKERKDFQTTYRLRGQEAVLDGPQLDGLKVRLVSYGAAIDHLEFVPPGRDTTVYAYRCGN